MVFESYLVAQRVLADGMMDLQSRDSYPLLWGTLMNAQMAAPGRTSEGATSKKLSIATFSCEGQSRDASTRSLCWIICSCLLILVIHSRYSKISS
jgi:hypothetical protein